MATNQEATITKMSRMWKGGIRGHDPLKVVELVNSMVVLETK